MEIKYLMKVGDIYGNLTVISLQGKWRHHGWLIKCLCKCGNICYRERRQLVVAFRAGCSYPCRIDLLMEEALINSLLYRIQKDASKRKWKWELTKEETKLLLTGSCFYCGIEPKTRFPVHTTNHTTKVYIKYNGIDRLNNNIGYTTLNCVSCCPTCNYFKGQKNMNVLVNKVKRIYKYLDLENSYNIIDMAKNLQTTEIGVF